MNRACLAAAEARAAEIRMPELVSLPGAGPVLLVAPHPDDEVLGAGGTLCKHAEAGHTVNVVFVTDGRRGGRSRGRPDELAVERRQEAKAACKELGVSGVHFLGAADGTFRPDSDLVDALCTILDRHGPHLLYVPGFEERHRDHLLTAALVAEACARRRDALTICAYEVWTPVDPSCVVNVTRQMERKRAAMRCHVSQLEQRDYLAAMDGLARYRAALIPFPNVTFAEAFRRSTAEAFMRALFEFLNVHELGRTPSDAERMLSS